MRTSLGFSLRLISFIVFIFTFNTIEAQIGSVSGVVSDEFGPLPGAKIILLGENISTTCDAKGAYSFKIKPGKYIVKATYLMYKGQTKPINVSFNTLEIESNFILEWGSLADQNFSVGSRAAPKSQLETASGVQIISHEEIVESNQTSVTQILQYLIPSFYSTHQTIADGTDHIDPATLRGLGPDQLLVLVDGKRYHSSSLVNVNGTIGRGSVGSDLNSIPIGAIDRIEVLKDGAAAQYGSDAIAGVINIILKEQTGVTSVTAHFQPTIKNDGAESMLSAYYGEKIGKKGFVSLTTEYRNREAINRSGDYNGNVYSSNDSIDKILVEERNFFSNVGYGGDRIMQIGSSKTRDVALLFNSKIPVNNVAEIYANGKTNFRGGESRGFYRLPINEDQVTSELYPDGFSPEIHTDINDNNLIIGLRGNKGGWLIDLSRSVGVNALDFTIMNSNNASLSLLSPTNLYAGGFNYTQQIANLDFSRKIDSLLFINTLNVAFGFAHRSENYIIIEGEEASFIDGGDTTSTGDPKAVGVQVFPGFRPEDALNKQRINTSSYIDVEAVILEKLLISSAVRYEIFSDFGTNLSCKIASRLALTKSLSVRGSYNTGFRAPSLHQIFFNNVGTQFIDGEPFEVGTFNNESPVTRALGIKELTPETSTNTSVGITGKISDNLSVSVDGYQIRIKDRIVLSGRFGEGYEEILEPFGVGAAQFFTNAVNTNTRGADVSIRFNHKINKGRLVASILYNYGETKVDDLIETSGIIDGEEETLFNREEVSRLEVAQPKSKTIMTLNYKISKWNFLVRATRFTEVTYIHPEDGDPSNWVLNEFTGVVETRDQTFDPKITVDLTITLKLTKAIKWSVGGTNVFNIYPDKLTHYANTNEGSFVYSRRVQQFGIKGASYLTKLAVVF